MKVYIFHPKGEQPIEKGRRCNLMFSGSKDHVDPDCEEVFMEKEVTQEEYDFMVEYWDDCIDQEINPEVYLG